MHGLFVSNGSGFTVIDSTYKGMYQVAEGMVTLSNGFASLPDPEATYGTGSLYFLRDTSNGVNFLRVGGGYHGYGVYAAQAQSGSQTIYGTGNVYYKVFSYSSPIDSGGMGLKVYSESGELVFNSDKKPLQICADLKGGDNNIYPVNEYLIGPMPNGYTPFLNPKVGFNTVFYSGGFPPTIIVHECAANIRFDGTNYWLRTKNFMVTGSSGWAYGWNQTLGSPSGVGLYNYSIAGAVV